jgi:GTPase SAR1 family protein
MVLGDNGVGKSSLVMRFIWNRIVEDFGTDRFESKFFCHRTKYMKTINEWTMASCHMCPLRGESHPQADPFIEDEYLKNFTFPDCNTPLLYYIHDTGTTCAIVATAFSGVA